MFSYSCSIVSILETIYKIGHIFIQPHHLHVCSSIMGHLHPAPSHIYKELSKDINNNYLVYAYDTCMSMYTQHVFEEDH